MPDQVDPSDPNFIQERRRRAWRKLIEEGALQDKPPRELTEDDLDQIDLRLSLEDHAAEDGISVEELFAEMNDDSKYTIGPFSAEEMIEYIHRVVADGVDQPTDNTLPSNHAGDAD